MGAPGAAAPTMPCDLETGRLWLEMLGRRLQRADARLAGRPRGRRAIDLLRYQQALRDYLEAAQVWEAALAEAQQREGCP